MADPVDPQYVRDEVRDSIGQWLQGHYTDVLADGLQRRLTIVDNDEHRIRIRVDRLGRHGGSSGTPKLFDVFVEVKEVVP